MVSLVILIVGRRGTAELRKTVWDFGYFSRALYVFCWICSKECFFFFFFVGFPSKKAKLGWPFQFVSLACGSCGGCCLLVALCFHNISFLEVY